MDTAAVELTRLDSTAKDWPEFLMTRFAARRVFCGPCTPSEDAELRSTGAEDPPSNDV